MVKVLLYEWIIRDGVTWPQIPPHQLQREQAPEILKYGGGGGRKLEHLVIESGEIYAGNFFSSGGDLQKFGLTQFPSFPTLANLALTKFEHTLNNENHCFNDAFCFECKFANNNSNYGLTFTLLLSKSIILTCEKVKCFLSCLFQF